MQELRDMAARLQGLQWPVGRWRREPPPFTFSLTVSRVVMPFEVPDDGQSQATAPYDVVDEFECVARRTNALDPPGASFAGLGPRTSLRLRLGGDLQIVDDANHLRDASADGFRFGS